MEELTYMALLAAHNIAAVMCVAGPFYMARIVKERARSGKHILFQSSGDPDDLDNFVDRDARKAIIWVQMKGGDNQEMQRVENRLATFMRDDPPPAGLSLQWSGLTYINKTWQDLMVSGMMKAILGSFPDAIERRTLQRAPQYVYLCARSRECEAPARTCFQTIPSAGYRSSHRDVVAVSVAR